MMDALSEASKAMEENRPTMAIAYAMIAQAAAQQKILEELVRITERLEGLTPGNYRENRRSE